MQSVNEIVSIPDNMDLSNPYKLAELLANNMTFTTYTPGMTSIPKGNWAFDTRERAYWVYPNAVDASNQRGYFSLRSDSYMISPGDEVEIEFDIKVIGAVTTTQILGAKFDLLDASLAFVSSIDARTYDFSQEYQKIKYKRIVNPGLTTVKYFKLTFGLYTSPLQDFSFKIRDIKYKIKRNTATLQGARSGTVTTFQNAWTGTINYTRGESGIATIEGSITPGTKTAGFAICNIPSGYRPKRFLMIWGKQTVNGKDISLVLDVSGGLSVSSDASTANILDAQAIQFQITFQAE